jgi:hypothetical protein
MTRSIAPKLFGLALVALLGAGTACAQYGYSPQPGYWYHEESPAHEAAERARSFGYHDGLAEGERDRVTGHSFRPTHSDRYEDASDHGQRYGLSRDEFKSIYREAYLRGYQRGYGSY